MKHRLWFILFSLLLSTGCKTTFFEETLPSGLKVRARDTRFFLNTKASISAVVNPTNGILTIKVDAQSQGDVASLQAISEGVAKGVVQGLK